MVKCSICGTYFDVSLSLAASGKVRVAHCRVCPVNRVYAICERCANLEQVQQRPCPWCGAKHLWQVEGMLPQMSGSRPGNWSDYATWFNKGNALYRLERYEEALDAYEHARRIFPDFDAHHRTIFDAYYWKGNALFQLKRYEEALDAYEHAVQTSWGLTDEYFVAYCHKGYALSQLERYEEALDAYEHALQLQPKFFSTWFSTLYTKGDILFKLERYEEALETYERVLRFLWWPFNPMRKKVQERIRTVKELLAQKPGQQTRGEKALSKETR